METDVLARARMLAKAANEVADQMSQQVHEFKAVVQARRAHEAAAAAIEVEKKSKHDSDRSVSEHDLGSQKV
jgi:hypothetical protein